MRTGRFDVACVLACLCLSQFLAAPLKAASDYAPFLSGNGVYMDTLYNGNGTTGVIPTSGDFTVEFWATCAVAPNSHREIISQGSPGNAFYVGTDPANNIRLGDTWSSTGVPYPLGGWHHFAVVRSSTNTIFYLDGVKRLSRGSAISNPSDTGMRLGRQYGGGAEYWQGGIDEVRIWSLARSAEDIRLNRSRKLTGSESGLRNYWQFNRNSSSTSMSLGYNSCWIYSRPNNDIYWQESGMLYVPDVSTGATLDISPIGATLHGWINSGVLPAAAWFEWGVSGSYGNVTPAVSAATPEVPQEISSVLTNLSEGASYHYRLVVTNIAGPALGNDMTFLTPRFASSGPTTISSPTSASLNGTVEPFTSSTTTWFEWGTDTNYGTLTAAESLSVAHGTVSVSASISNLVAGVAYHFRLHATNILKQSAGDDTVFTIPAFNDVPHGLPAVGYGSVAWGDYDNDGWLDILISGELDYDAKSVISRVYRNKGDGTFADINAGLPGIRLGAAAWGDYDNDGRLDIMISGLASTEYISRIYRNNGDGTFSWNQSAIFPGLLGSAVAWGDYNNDGLLDIIISGHAMTGYAVTFVFQNCGDGTFTDSHADVIGTEQGSVIWGDCDNDGWLDILIAGAWDSSGIRLYRNNRNGTFTDANAGLPPGSAVALGDYNNDGWLDIVLSRSLDSSRIFRNNGDGSFTDIQIDLPVINYGSLAWGDYDNDGRPDILLAGGSVSDPIACVYRNNGDGTFSGVNCGVRGAADGATAWGDYNSDGRLDFLVSGWYERNVVIDRNNNYAANNAPNPPSGLTSTVSSNRVTLSWSGGSDAETPVRGLTYNVRVGTRPGGSDILSSGSNPINGFRRLQQMGNAQLGTYAIIDISRLPDGVSCYWTVQAVDGAYAGSAWAPEAKFTLPGQPCFDKWGLTGGGRLECRWIGLEKRTYTVVYTTNLSSPVAGWIPVGVGEEVTPGRYRFVDTNAVSDPQRFYRAR